MVRLTISLMLLTLPAAALDYALGVFGNANEDDTINMRDVTRIELVIPGKRKELIALQPYRIDHPFSRSTSVL